MKLLTMIGRRWIRPSGKSMRGSSVWVGSGFIVLIAIGLATVAWVNCSSANFAPYKVGTGALLSSPARESVIPPSAGPAQSSQIRTVLITICPTGFDPVEIKVADGHFRIAVDNKSGLDEVTLLLAREGGALVRQMHLPPGQLKWREKLDLPDGRYALTETTHPAWLCNIIIGN